MYSKLLATLSSFFGRFLHVFSRSPKNAHPIVNLPKERKNDRNLDGYTMNTLSAVDVENTMNYYCEYHEIQPTEMTLDDWDIVCNVMMISAMATEINSYEEVGDFN